MKTLILLLTVITLASVAVAQSKKDKFEIGIQSTYFYQERSSRRWKLLIAAGVVAAVNLVAMFVASGV
jgi:hypothetical protein